MKNDYLCPTCKGHLKVNEFVVFSVETPEGAKGLVFLSPELGNYNSVKHPSLEIKDGSNVNFFCPICHADLAAPDVSDNLARIVVTDDNNSEAFLLFSKVVGEKCTFKVHDDEVETFGEDSTIYMNYFGEKPKF